MSFEVLTTAATPVSRDSALAKILRWIAGKVWFGAVLSSAWAVGDHYGWPEAILTAMATLGAVGLAVTVVYLPVWTEHWTTGARPVDFAAKTIVWLGVTAPVAALLIGQPAVGAPAGALLLITAGRTFGRHLNPLLVRLHLDHLASKGTHRA
jgi:hypothetical protein